MEETLEVTIKCMYNITKGECSMQHAEIKEKDLVTLNVAPFIEGSNTYIVAGFLENGMVCLNHPLVPECYIIKPMRDLNNVQPILRSPFERCLWFANKHKAQLGHINSLALEAILLLYVTKKTLSSAQKHEIHVMCGKIASIHVDGNINFAVKKVRENEALLDTYNLREYKRLEKFFKNPENIIESSHRQVILRVAGFILAQEME